MSTANGEPIGCPSGAMRRTKIAMLPSDQKKPSPPWTREQIRDARKVALVLLLERRGHQAVETGGGNFLVPAFPGLIVKDSYWRWPERNQSGNAIDFLVQVVGLSFHDAMEALTDT